jgi:hypothetical protein
MRFRATKFRCLRLNHQEAILQSCARTPPAPLQFVHCPFRLDTLQIDRVQEADMGTIASSLSSLMSLFEQKLKLIRSSATSIHVSFSGFSLVLKISLAFTRNRDQCLRFLRCCADYGEIVAAFCTPPTVWPTVTSSHVMESPNLRDRAMRPQFEATSVFAESATRIKGLSSYSLKPFGTSHVY